MATHFLDCVRKTIDRYHLLRGGEKVLVAFSGGPDSTALLHTLRHLKAEYRLSLCAGYYNHRLRGEESEREEEFVRARVETQLGIPLRAARDDGALAAVSANREEEARTRRYEFLRRAAAESGAEKIALGHTANDQAETFFLWLFRGAGTRGLGGMPPAREGVFIRPLIRVGREAIIRFLEEAAVPWIEDSSNRLPGPMRNRIRQELIPRLVGEFDPLVLAKIARTTEILREEDGLLEAQSEAAYQELRTKEEGAVLLRVERLQELPLPLQRRVVRRAIQETQGSLRRVSFVHLEAIEHLLESPAPQGSTMLPDELEVTRLYTWLRFGKPVPPNEGFCYQFNTIPEEIAIKETGQTLNARVYDWRQGKSVLTEADRALMDFEAVRFPLTVRPWKEGDRFQPLGVKGTRKVKDFFIDRKLPREARRKTPLVLFGERIAWVVGQRIDERVKVTSSTRKVLELRVVSAKIPVVGDQQL